MSIVRHLATTALAAVLLAACANVDVERSASSFGEDAHASPNPKSIEFGEMLWNIRRVEPSESPVPPGYNYFSGTYGRNSSVFVDNSGRLHLAITRRGSLWYSAEVSTVLPVGPGEYRFRVILPNKPPLDDHVAVAIFIYADDEHEIDVELSKFLSRFDGTCKLCDIQYVLQPFEIDGNWQKFTWPETMYESIHEIKWFENGEVELSSFLAANPKSPVFSEKFHLPSQAAKREYRLHLSIWLEDIRGTHISKGPENCIRQEVIFEVLALPRETSIVNY